MRIKVTPSGYMLQFYRGAGGFSFEKLVANMPRYKAAGVTAIAPHGFVNDLDVAKFEKYALLAQQYGMLCYAAFGLGSSHARDRGIWIGKVAQHPLCAGILFDAEGGFEDEDTDKQAAIDLGKGFLSQFPGGVADVWACDQPWAVPTLHWTRFPWVEIAAFVDARAAQFYYNDWKGADRYIKLGKWFYGAWVKLNEHLTATNSVKPLMMTLQAYGWADIFPDQIDCLLKNPNAILWCDQGLPSENSLLALHVVKTLADKGFKGPDAVLLFQKAYNTSNPVNKITEDGRCGYGETVAALGLTVTAEMRSAV